MCVFVFFLQVSWLSRPHEWVCSRCAERFIPSLCFVCGVSGSEWKSVVEVSAESVFCFFLSWGEWLEEGGGHCRVIGVCFL